MLSELIGKMAVRRREPGAAPRDRSGKRGRVAAGGILAWTQFCWACLVLALWAVAVMRLPFDPEYTAGEMLDHLMGWRETGRLYTSLGQGLPLRVLNYPPLVPLQARALVELGLSPLAAGRLLNLFALVALAWVVAMWTRDRGGRGARVAGTVGLLATSFGIVYGSGQFHVELWAVALTACGFWLLHRADRRDRAALAGVALALACFAKHSQVVPMLGALLWAHHHRRGIAASAAGAVLGIGAAGALAMTAAWGIEPWRHLLTYTVGTYSWRNLGIQFASHVAPLVLLLGWGGWLARRRPADALSWYWAVSAAWSLAAAREGSGYPYFLDLHVATVMLVGPRLFGPWRSRFWGTAMGLQVLAADVGVAAVAMLLHHQAATVAAALPSLCRRLGDQPLALVETPGLARACGRVPAMHPFIATSLAARGYWDPTAIERAVRAGAYPAILLSFDPRQPDRVASERWTPGMLAAFRGAPTISPAGGGRWVVEW